MRLSQICPSFRADTGFSDHCVCRGACHFASRPFRSDSEQADPKITLESPIAASSASSEAVLGCFDRAPGFAGQLFRARRSSGPRFGDFLIPCSYMVATIGVIP